MKKISNSRRAAYAERAIVAHVATSGNSGNDKEESLTDLMSDLLHLARKWKVSVSKLLKRAQMHFEAEEAGTEI